ncbi:carbohydrate ABC transporter permease [Oceanispirochaeta sp.]|jgi:multiple sugar transport system permease protein|uniref:carbohydrate ABC transporter permease n=1 Tax=Oceanispirochaeta sp. TaxID=2035350 RepID=UPI0026087027|nr:carbohydrate ABC transporter permease [Oceanispirochaeta sp.]MDA3957490.1 carbohydrate ABC transporter permease [Oceanispirochaeta sp.]
MLINNVNKTAVYRQRTGRYLLLSAIALIFIFPMVFMVMSSLKPSLQLLRDTSSMRAFLPVGDLSLNNYSAAFRRVPIGRFLFNSTFVTGITVILGIMINSMAAYSFSILKWKGKGIILSIIIATFIIPFETIAIPLLLIVNKLPWIGFSGFSIGWMNSYHVQIIPFLAYSFQIFLFYQFFKEIPKDFIEAARIDGAGWFAIYSKMVIPISGPVIATAAILRFLDMWNQYLWPKMVIQSEEFRPVMVGLQYFFQLNIPWGEVMAYLSIITIPVLAFYLAMQSAFIESIASTGIKG